MTKRRKAYQEKRNRLMAGKWILESETIAYDEKTATWKCLRMLETPNTKESEDFIQTEEAAKIRRDNWNRRWNEYDKMIEVPSFPPKPAEFNWLS